jgi:2-hydroxy-6-oxonona-2,4-dienedioate hydrolase
VSAPVQEIDVAGRRVCYRDAGAGPVAIVAAGLGLSGRFYDASYDAFADAGLRLIVPDHPGWGRTAGSWTGLSPVGTTSFLLDFAAALDVPRAVWIGHSLGAQAVAELAARQPARAAGIVLAGPTGRPGRRRLLRQVWGLAVEVSRTTPGVIGAVARDYLRTTPLHYLGTWIRYSGHELLPRLPQVQCPALILAGDADPVCTPDFIELLRHRLPHARVAWVKGGTHALPRAHAAEFNRVVIGFLRELAR